MGLKPKDYKNIPDKEKKDLKFEYEHEKARREVMEENLEMLKKKTPIEYLDLLNNNIKEKLIGLCLNKKILEAYENDSFNGDEETKELEEDKDEIEGEEEEEEETD